MRNPSPLGDPHKSEKRSGVILFLQFQRARSTVLAGDLAPPNSKTNGDPDNDKYRADLMEIGNEN